LINDEDSDGDFEGFDLEEEGLMNVAHPEMNVVEDRFMRNPFRKVVWDNTLTTD